MYKHMLRHGYRDLVVFPLQLLPSSATSRDVLYAEQQWMHRFNSLIPHGYNARLAHRDVPVPPAIFSSSTTVAFKDMCRRVYHCYKSWVCSSLTATNHTQFFTTYLTSTLERMYSFCCRGGGEGGVSVTDPLGRWRVPAEFIDTLRPWLQHDILHRRGAPLRTSARKLLICSYWSTVFDRIDFKTAFTSPQAVAALLPSQLEQIPVLGFKYGKPLRSKFCNYAVLANSDRLSPADIQHHLNIAVNGSCVCHTDPWYAQNGFVAPCGHVITCDSAALKNFPPDLKYLFMSELVLNIDRIC